MLVGQEQESRLIEGGYHDEAPFFREAISLLDQSTKLTKDDRIVLRNKIKLYLRTLRENKAPEQQEVLYLNELIHIFIEANRKKSLAKIQKGDRTMDWLQIKLRKFIDHHKKEKHRREIQNFKRRQGSKGMSKGRHDLYDHLNEESRSSSRHRQPEKKYVLAASRANNFSNYQNPSRKTTLQTGSLSRSREGSEIYSSRRRDHQRYVDYSYHQNFSFLRKGKEPVPHSKQSQQERPQYDLNTSKAFSKPTGHLNRSLEHISKFNRSFLTSKDKASRDKGQADESSKVNKYSQKSEERAGKQDSQMSKHQISRLTQLFTKQLNTDTERENREKQREIEREEREIQREREREREQLERSEKEESRFDHLQFSILEGQANSNPPVSEEVQSPTFNFDGRSRYQESTKKIEQMLQGSKLLLQQAHPEEITSAATEIPLLSGSTFSPVQLSAHPLETLPMKSVAPLTDNFNDLFTPPDFLAECRKFIETSSHKKPQLQAEPQQEGSNELNERQGQQEQQQTLTFNTLLNFPPVTFSQDPSAKISSNKPRIIPSIHTPEDLLKAIFHSSHRVTLELYQIGEIMSKCSSELESLLQKYCDLLKEESPVFSGPNCFEFSFIPMLKYFYTYGMIFREEDHHFASFLCSILDMKKNGYVTMEDVEDFIESMESSEIESETLELIRGLLTKVFRECCVVEGESEGGMMTRWSMFYLELRQLQQVSSLRDQLSRFQFQVDND